MSVYTTELRYICEEYSGFGTGGHRDTNRIIADALPRLFDFEFPIFDEAYRSTLETKICRHFYYREIGAESVGLWKDFLQTKLNEIMPYYNQLYFAQLREYNPNYEVDIHKEYTRIDDNQEQTYNQMNAKDAPDLVTTEEGTNSGMSTDTEKPNRTTISSGSNTGTVKQNTSNTSTDDTTTDSKRKMSDTPQGATSNLDADGYLTEYNHDVTEVDGTKTDTGESTVTNNLSNSVTTTETGSNERIREDNLSNRKETHQHGTNVKEQTDDGRRKIDNTQTYSEHVFGVQNATSFMDSVFKFRDAIINIDMMIIGELEVLFMNLW